MKSEEGLWCLVQKPGKLEKGVTHITPRKVSVSAVGEARAAARKERAGRRKRRREHVLSGARRRDSG